MIIDLLFFLWLLSLRPKNESKPVFTIKYVGTILPKPEYMRVTCYTWTGNHMANGEYPYEGCVAYKSENIGDYAVIYDTEMNLIGVFEIKDTGGNLIQSGQRLDVYRDTLDGCFEWVGNYGDYLYVQIISAEMKEEQFND